MKGTYQAKFETEKLAEEFAEELICYKKAFHGRGIKSREFGVEIELDYYGGPTRYRNFELTVDVLDEHPLTRFILDKYHFQKVGVA